MRKWLWLCVLAFSVHPSMAEETERQKQLRMLNPITSEDYFKKSVEINNLRKERLLDMGALLEAMADKNTVILDVRGDASFRQEHIKGATHLSLADITPATLAKAIPTKETRVVLYCDAALIPYPTRKIPASTQAYPLIYQHGYANLYEVGELWRSDWLSSPPKDVEGMRREYTNYLKIPFEGDARIIDHDRTYVEQALAKAK